MLSSAWMRYCLILWTLDVHLCSRSPQGERGLKSCAVDLRVVGVCRSPQGERGLKLPSFRHQESSNGRSPQGERGLKYIECRWRCLHNPSFPARGAWIEIATVGAFTTGADASFPARGAWIEITRRARLLRSNGSRSPQGERGLKFVRLYRLQPNGQSFPARGAWIEIK